jgi:small acid-soluble spore protein F (minor alpha/beta-type SASP)
MTEKSKRSRKSRMKRRPLEWDDSKMEIAREIGLLDKVYQEGWAGLTAEESGRIGGILSRRFPGKAPVEEKKK